MKNLCLLGATGSIGHSTLEIVRANPHKYCLKAFSFCHNIKDAEAIIEEFAPDLVATPINRHQEYLKSKYTNLIITNNILEVATFKCPNPVVINALVGSVGLKPTIAAITNKRDVLLANKETLVMAGSIVMQEAKKQGVKIIPIDSEHSAIFQILNGQNKKEINKIIITASGGALYNKNKSELKNITTTEALNHPNWKMGAKITIDSATMVNKAFEVIEAHHLFDLPFEKIQTIIHPESIIHSMVEFNDYSIFAQMATSDMKIPIQYALSYPEHVNNLVSKSLDLTERTLNFHQLDVERFEIMQVLQKVIKKDGFYPVVFNASNEKLVELFLKGKITFDQIVSRIKEEIDKTEELYGHLPYNLENVLIVDELVKANIN